MFAHTISHAEAQSFAAADVAFPDHDRIGTVGGVDQGAQVSRALRERAGEDVDQSERCAVAEAEFWDFTPTTR
jgi:hypothetical protein